MPPLRRGPLRSLLGAAVAFATAAAVPASAAPSPSASSGVVYFNTSEGSVRLKHASHDRPFWALMPHHSTELPGNCGPTTAVVILNALLEQGVEAPASTEWARFPRFSYRYWDQGNVRGEPNASCVRRALTPWQGSLEQVSALFACRGLDANATLASASSAEQFRAALKDAFEHEPVRHVAVNFYRKVLGQEGWGHHSPVGAYDEATDSVLVLDVARYKYPPWWVPLPRLFEAMVSDTNIPGETPRGFLVVGGKRGLVEPAAPVLV